MIPWELHYRLVVIDLDKKVLTKIVRKELIIRERMWNLNENRTRVTIEKKSIKTSKHRLAQFVENFQRWCSKGL